MEPRRAAPEADLTHDLYERYGHQIFNFCLHQLGNREEAEDATQTTFMNAFRGLQRGVVPELESAWLFKIANNVILTRRRSTFRRRRVETPGDLDAIQDLLPSRERNADELIRLSEALSAMPDQQRRALLLREWQGLSYHEIAEELSLSQSAVETLLFRARRTLAAGLTEAPKERKRGRLRSGVDIGSVIAAFKTLLTGSAAVKTVATVAAVATTAVVAAAPTPHPRSLRPEPPAPAVTTTAPTQAHAAPAAALPAAPSHPAAKTRAAAPHGALRTRSQPAVSHVAGGTPLAPEQPPAAAEPAAPAAAAPAPTPAQAAPAAQPAPAAAPAAAPTAAAPTAVKPAPPAGTQPDGKQPDGKRAGKQADATQPVPVTAPVAVAAQASPDTQDLSPAQSWDANVPRGLANAGDNASGNGNAYGRDKSDYGKPDKGSAAAPSAPVSPPTAPAPPAAPLIAATVAQTTAPTAPAPAADASGRSGDAPGHQDDGRGKGGGGRNR